jgi:hypothetical protein
VGGGGGDAAGLGSMGEGGWRGGGGVLPWGVEDVDAGVGVSGGGGENGFVGAIVRPTGYESLDERAALEDGAFDRGGLGSGVGVGALGALDGLNAGVVWGVEEGSRGEVTVVGAEDPVVYPEWGPAGMGGGGWGGEAPRSLASISEDTSGLAGGWESEKGVGRGGSVRGQNGESGGGGRLGGGGGGEEEKMGEAELMAHEHSLRLLHLQQEAERLKAVKGLVELEDARDTRRQKQAQMRIHTDTHTHTHTHTRRQTDAATETGTNVYTCNTERERDRERERRGARSWHKFSQALYVVIFLRYMYEDTDD